MMIAFALQLFLPGWEIGFSPWRSYRVFVFNLHRYSVWLAAGAKNAARLDPVDALARE